MILNNVVRNFSHINKTSSSTLLTWNKYNFCRYQSTEANAESPGWTATIESTSIPVIPEPPTVPVLDTSSTIAETLAQGAEPAFASLGLGGWTPVGMVQNCMEYLHIDAGCPWWTCIMIGTIFVRTVIFPLVIMSQRNSAKLNNNMPQMQFLQQKMTEARQTGNALDAAKYSNELALFMREKEINPLKNMIVPFAQAPLFISFFIGLRQMANAPVESMTYGGLFWFNDLTVPDPYYILPIITSCTMLLTIEIGTDGARMSATNMQTMRYVLRALPFVILPFTVTFPGAILTYWTFSNFFSLLQVSFLKIPAVRAYFNIEKLKTFKPHELPIKKKGFTEGIKDSWSNMKITRELEERRRIDDMVFQRAAKGAVPKTYKFDPTKAKPLNAVEAKKS